MFIFLITSACEEVETRSTKEILEEKNEKYKEQVKLDSIAKIEKKKAQLAAIDTNLITQENVVEKLTYYGNLYQESKVKITTKFGDIYIKLYDDVPLHKANFLMLTHREYFNGTIFYRVLDDFMIQGGNSDRDDITAKMKSIGSYVIPEEISEKHFHKRGALAMAVKEQLETPDSLRHKNSSSFNFYIVQEGPKTYDYLSQVEKSYEIDIPSSHKKVYNSIGGAPHLDGNYTVFGEVYQGMDVVDKIAGVKTDDDDRPDEDITMKIEVID